MSNVAATECTQCGGTGWKTIPGGSTPGGKARPPRAARCECRLAERAGLMLKAARIPARYEHCTLESFSTDYDNEPHPPLAKAKLFAGRFVEEYPREQNGLLLIGPVGVGKTHLAVGILKELILQKNVGCLFCDYRELLKQIQNSYNPAVAATELDILRPVFDAEVLVLDELGAVKPTEWAWDTVALVLNSRYNDKRTTIITTNYKDLPAGAAEPESTLGRARAAAREEGLGDRIGERMRSRLHEMCRIVEFSGADYRQHYKSATPVR